MRQLTENGLNEIIDLKLETTRAICTQIINTGIASLSTDEQKYFTNVIELVAILMIKHAGEFPDKWTCDNLLEVCRNTLPLLLDSDVQIHTKNILLTYVNIIYEVFGFENYATIKKNLAS